MKRGLAISLICLVSLSGCSMLFPEDSRIGAEPQVTCHDRVLKSLPPQAKRMVEIMEVEAVPTFTYDVTKLSLEEIQEISLNPENETLGTRLNQASNETSTARDRFMDQEVSEAGAFFLGRDPALYRVSGPIVPVNQMITAGCQRQQENMRLIGLSWERPQSTESEQSKNSESENNS